MSELAGSEQNDAEIALTEEQTLAKDAKTRALANEVWSTLEIRSAIVEHMDTTELPETIHLDKASLATVAKRLYREITYIEYDRFAWQGSSVSAKPFRYLVMAFDNSTSGAGCTPNLYESSTSEGLCLGSATLTDSDNCSTCSPFSTSSRLPAAL